MKILRTTIILYACEYAHEFISYADLTLKSWQLFTVFTVKIRQGSGTNTRKPQQESLHIHKKTEGVLIEKVFFFVWKFDGKHINTVRMVALWGKGGPASRNEDYVFVLIYIVVLGLVKYFVD